jgi:hypothetical protein
MNTRTKQLFLTSLALIAILGCGGGKRLVTGSITVRDTDQAYSTGALCRTEGGYDDVRVGTDVVVKDGQGAIIGVGSLEDGQADSAFDCRFDFSLEVKDSEFYSFEVGDRGEISYSRADLEAQAWDVSFSLGD